MGMHNRGPSRQEVSERISRSREDMTERTRDTEIVVDDLDTVRHTLDSLDLGGTREGIDDIVGRIAEARDETIDIYRERNDTLERTQEGAESYEGELEERCGKSESDRAKIADAARGVDTGETRRGLERADAGAGRDIEFLGEKIRAAAADLAASRDAARNLQSRVHEGKGR